MKINDSGGKNRSLNEIKLKSFDSVSGPKQVSVEQQSQGIHKKNIELDSAVISKSIRKVEEAAQELKASMLGDNPLNKSKVDRLAQLVANNAYSVDSREVAKRIINRLNLNESD
ncbi:MAG: flagellar biosynthesis anti-sigma factor FlgM [Deltaproteobacteria bacterium]|nr:flagellar biosynthesis anti-sigma factor FlgM [Deltaproteobacteria bacterium]